MRYCTNIENRSGSAKSVFIRATENLNRESLQKLVDDVLIPAEVAPDNPMYRFLRLKVTPLSGVHAALPLKSTLDGNNLSEKLKLNNGDIALGVLAIGLAILFLAAANSFNLSMATFQKRFKDIAVRQSCGATSRQLAWQHLFESTLITTTATLIALACLPLSLTSLGHLLQIELYPLELLSPLNITALFCAGLLTGALIGLHPLRTLISRSPADNIQQQRTQGRQRIQKALIGMQSAIAGSLIFLALTAYLQVNSLLEHDYGINTVNITDRVVWWNLCGRQNQWRSGCWRASQCPIHYLGLAL